MQVTVVRSNAALHPSNGFFAAVCCRFICLCGCCVRPSAVSASFLLFAVPLCAAAAAAAAARVTDRRRRQRNSQRATHAEAEGAGQTREEDDGWLVRCDFGWLAPLFPPAGRCTATLFVASSRRGRYPLRQHARSSKLTAPSHASLHRRFSPIHTTSFVSKHAVVWCLALLSRRAGWQRAHCTRSRAAEREHVARGGFCRSG